MKMFDLIIFGYVTLPEMDFKKKLFETDQIKTKKNRLLWKKLFF